MVKYDIQRTYPLEEHSGLAQDMTGLDELLEAGAEQLVALVHLRQPRLVLAQRHVQLVHRLRSTWAHRNQRRRVVQRPHRYRVLFLLDLRREEPDAARHFVDPPDLADERPLERVHVRVQLGRLVRYLSSKYSIRGTYVFELDVSELSEFRDGVMGNLRRHEQLHKAHRIRAYAYPSAFYPPSTYTTLTK